MSYQSLKPFKRGKWWKVRFRRPDGSRPEINVGLIADFPKKESAILAAEKLRSEVNAGQPVMAGQLFGSLIDLYIAEEMPKRHSTSSKYLCNLKNHIKPKWENEPIERLKNNPLDIRRWFEKLPLAGKTKANIKSLMNQLFDTAMLHKLIPQGPNPMDLVHLKSTKRKKRPGTRTPEECRAIRARLEQPFRLMAVMCQCYGPRASEFLGFQWQDFKFAELKFKICRGVVDGRVDSVKTEYSEKWLPLDPMVAAELLAWRAISEFVKDEDFVFASPYLAGEKPYSYTCALKKLKKAGGTGWHIFRHTYRTLVDQTGAPIGVQKDLMRHSDVRTTMNVYGDSLDEALREPSGKVVRMVM